MVAVHDVGIEVNADGPCHGADSRIDVHLREQRRIVEWRERAIVQHRRQVPAPDEIVGSDETQPKTTEVFDIDDPRWATHARSLPKTFDGA